MKAHTIAIRTILLVSYIILYVPLICVVIYSFNAAGNMAGWTGWSTKWYVALMSNQMLWLATWNTLKVALFSATCAAIIGTAAAIAIYKHKRFFMKPLFLAITSMPIAIPDVVMGLSMLLFFAFLKKLTGWPTSGGLITIAIAHVTVGIAYVQEMVQARLLSYDISLEEAAMDLGSRPMKVFFTITLPVIAPAIISGWFFAFVLSVDDVIMAMFLSGPESVTLPIMIMGYMKAGAAPEINALTGMLLLILSIIMLIVGLLIYRKKHI